MSTSCFICLETFTQQYSTKRLCQTCPGSTICNTCEQKALRSENPDILTNCPLCRKFLGNTLSGIQLISFWHPLLIIFWNCKGINSPLWEQFLFVYLAQGGLAGICRKTNIDYENSRPSLLLKRWNLFNLMIHVPYMVYTHFMGTDSRDEFYNIYLAGYFLFPLLSTGVLKMGLLFLQRLVQRRYTS
jgi:hypothetical protein